MNPRPSTNALSKSRNESSSDSQPYTSSFQEQSPHCRSVTNILLDGEEDDHHEEEEEICYAGGLAAEPLWVSLETNYDQVLTKKWLVLNVIV